ncbi:unnamed protein product [Alternaria alternata]
MEHYLPTSARSKTMKLLNNKIRQRSRVNYESSVDTDHPVAVDETANPKWKRGQLCWEAKGECAQDYKDMEIEILKELNQSRRESFCELGISLFMVGKTPRNAKPIIIISSEDRTSREEAKKALINSGVLTRSGFEIGILKYLPSGPIHPVAGSPSEASWNSASTSPISESGGWDSDTWNNTIPGPSHSSSVPPLPSAYYDPEQRLRLTGMAVYVKMADGRSRMATANVVYNGSTYGYLTAAHVLDPWDRSSSSVDNGDEDLGVPFDSDSEDEDYCDEPVLLDGNLISRSETSADSSMSSNKNSMPLEPTIPTALSDPTELESPCPPDLTLLGQLAPGKSLDKSLDYAIIAVENTEFHQQRESLSFSKSRPTVHVPLTRFESSLATAWTTHGLIRGKVTGVPILMRLPGSGLFQSVFTFTYEGTIKNGDCGSLVLDTASKEIYGMIVAASDGQSIAYMVGAKELMSDIENAGWHLLSVDEHCMDSTEHQDEVASGCSPTIRSPRATSPPNTISRVVSSPTLSQPLWDENFQRHLITLWDAQYGRYYRTHFVEGQGWVFFDWAPPHISVDPVPASYGYNIYELSSRGPSIQGIYSPQNPAPSSHYESLDPSFFVRQRGFFQEGKVFSVLFTETAGANAVNGLNPTDYNTSLSRVRYNELAHTQVRRFIVVKQKRDFCFAVPIFSYGNRGTAKPGVVPDEHAIAYSYGMQPQLVYGEAPLVKASIPIVMEEGATPLVAASRIYFAIHHPISYNIKVKSLGYVHPEWLPTFLGYWHQEN